MSGFLYAILYVPPRDGAADYRRGLRAYRRALAFTTALTPVSFRVTG